MAVKLPTVVAAWKNFELNNFQHELDETASEITRKQDESEVSRKKLVDQLKEFKKNATEETRKVSAPLIKSFQNEVDYLCKRSKYAEGAFLKVYQKFLDIVDPVPSLENSIELEKKIGLQEELEIENKRMRETIQDYKEELKEVKNQDITIKYLKEKLKKFEDQNEVTVSSKLKEVEKELASAYSEKEQLLLETHEHSVQKLKEAEERCQVLHYSLEQAQSELFETKSRLDFYTEAKSGEIEMLMNDLERANQQAAAAAVAAQKELAAKITNESHLATYSATKENEANLNVKSIEVLSLEAEITGKEKEISQLIHDLKCLQTTFDSLKQNSSVEIMRLQDELADQKKSIANYESKLNKQRDYEEVKRELAIIKSVEFDSIEDLNKKNNSNSVASKPLELLLLEKNKTLQSDNTSLKLSNEDLQTKFLELEKECKNQTTLITEQQSLITQLESDLLAMQSLYPHLTTRDMTSSQTEIISEAVKDATNSIANKSQKYTNYDFSGPTKEIVGNASSHAEALLPIISAQRERFRSRNEELETEVAVKGNQIILLQNELDSLRADNLKLYEKIRFLQSYEGNTRATNFPDTYSESRYSNQYEKSLDPFMSFSQKEKQKRYASLSPFEKIVLSFGQLVLKSKGARTATFMYFTLLHCLVFLVLYKIAYIESCKRDFASDCAKKFAEHMHDVHGET